VRLFSRDRGRVGTFARGAKKSKKRYPGLMAPGLGNARMKERRGDLLALEELDVDPVLLSLGNDLRALGHASYLVELLERLLPEAEPQPDVFDLVKHALILIATKGPSAALLRSLELKLLQMLGWLPDIARGEDGGAGLDDDAQRIAVQLLMTPIDELPDVDDATLRSVARIFASHLRRLGGPPLKSVAFLQAVAGPGPSR
jgi:recombinational DNA repair protein (RecF pathway)